MASINKVILIGNLGADPELRYTKGGTPVADLRLATSRKFKSRDGGMQEDTQWHPVVFWGKQAELAERLLKKGQLVYVEGRLNNTSWTDEEDRTHHRTEVVGQTFLILSPKAESAQDALPAAEDRR